MARVGGMVEHGDTDSLPAHRSIIIAPVALFAPGVAVFDAGAQKDMAFARFVFAVDEAHGFGDANGHRAFFGVAEDQVFVGGFDCDVEVEEAFVVGTGINAEGSFVGAGSAAVGCDPFAGGANNSLVG